MAWVKLDDQFMRHPKVLAAGRDARDLYLAGLCYCGSGLTDGFVVPAALRILGADAEIDDPLAAAGRLVEVGLWEESDGGYIVHDYLEYQPSADQVKADHKANAERQAAFRNRKSNDGSNGVTNGHVTGPRPTPLKEVPNGTSSPHTPQAEDRKKKRKAAKTKEPTLTPEQLERFERWYQHWPRKENRAKAEESWAAIDPGEALVDKMIATTKLYAASEKWQDRNGEFIPHPSTWLNNARWNDTPPKVDPPSSRDGSHNGRASPQTHNDLDAWRRKHGLLPDDPEAIDVKGHAR